MKNYLFTIVLLFLGFSINAEAISVHEKISFDEITFKDNKITMAGKLLGKYEISAKEINEGNKEKTKGLEVTIFDENGKTVAKLDLEVTEKLKKNSVTITDASLKTLRDNVNHNPSNFINYEEDKNQTDSEVPQFDNVVRYLLSYKYF